MAFKPKTAVKDKSFVEKPVHYESASPTLLAAQPSEEPGKLKRPITVYDDWNPLRAHLEGRLMGMRSWRQSWWTQSWSDLGMYINPRRTIWLTQSAGGIPSPNNMTRGRPINEAIIDPTGTYATRICAGGLMSGLASPSRPWFKVVPAIRKFEIDQAGAMWLDETENRMYTVISGSNFYNSFAQECEDQVVFGTAPVIIYEDQQDIIRSYNPVVGEYYLSTGATLRNDGLFRLFLMTISQIVDFFGYENCTMEVRGLWDQKGSALETERIVAHAIEPNYGIQKSLTGKLPGNYTWREVYWIYGAANEKPLSLRGFLNQPFTAACWTRQSNDPYGRSVGMDVLPDIKQLQFMTRRMAEAIEKQVRPPLIADMKLKNQPSSILPGHVTYIEGLMGKGSGIRSIYDVNPDVAAMTNNIMQIQQRVKVGFFNDLFLMLEQDAGKKMTAYEVAQKLQEKLQVLGPVIEGMLNESLKPKLKRIYGIMKRRGLIDPPPDSMRGLPLEIEFVSTLALAQKAAATGGMERLVGLIGNMYGVFPEVRDLLNPDKFVEEFNQLLGNPSKIMRGPEEVAGIRQQQAADKAKQQSIANAGGAAHVAGMGADAAQTLSETKVGAGGDALSALLGMGGSGTAQGGQ